MPGYICVTVLISSYKGYKSVILHGMRTQYNHLNEFAELFFIEFCIKTCLVFAQFKNKIMCLIIQLMFAELFKEFLFVDVTVCVQVIFVEFLLFVLIVLMRILSFSNHQEFFEV